MRWSWLDSASTLTLVAGLVVLELLLLASGLENSSYAISLCLALPLALLPLRSRLSKQVAPPTVRAPRSERFVADRRALLDLGDSMLAQARRTQEPLTLIVFDQSDLPELGSIFGQEAMQQMVARISTTLDQLAGSRGVAARTGPTEFTVLMPGYGVDRSLAQVRQALGNTYAIEVDSEHGEVLLVPDFLARTVRSDAASVAEVHQAMRAAIHQAQRNDLERRDYLQRERESHTSRPASLGSGGQAGQGHELTLPVPLEMR